ncbi:GGDEF domain-containing protein [Nitrosomonas marina]|uniref:GGDEF domain-containing protein n=1 Tax=Nitrosomonas marina TaxID=917 RepID=UPI0015A55ADE|nr:GGDEF domain-containing protein [Nitrosomonas marina]
MKIHMDSFGHQLEQQNNEHLSGLFFAQIACVVFAGGIAIVTLCGWMVPAIASKLPDGWWLMTQNTALSILISAFAIILIRNDSNILVIRFCGLAVIIFTTFALYGYINGQSIAFESIKIQGNLTELSDQVPIHSIIFFYLYGASIIVAKKEKNQKHCNNARDFLTLLLIGMVLVIFSGYLFSATSLYSHSTETLVSYHTFVCMCLLTFTNFVRGVDGGIFSLFLGSGIGSYTARVALPWAIMGPFFVISAINYFWDPRGASQEIQIALSATLLSLMFFFIILWLSNKISHLENDLRTLALTDEMTGLYNLRAFSILGKQAFLESLRNNTILTLLYFDLDGLKKINDTQGHQVGSDMIIEFANLLKTNFRRNETIARIGGDEFVVLSKNQEVDTAAKRLADAVNAANARNNKRYRISYSEGKIIGKAENFGSLDDLLTQADVLMYENKKRKKLVSS